MSVQTSNVQMIVSQTEVTFIIHEVDTADMWKRVLWSDEAKI